MKKNETRIPIGQGSQVKRLRPEYQMDKTAQERRVQKTKEKQDNEKGDTGKDKEENDAKNKNVHGERTKFKERIT